MSFGPVVPSHGPRPARVAIVAEAPGQLESDQLQPLVGPSGWALRQMLKTIGVSLDDCYKCNVFSRQPSGNSVDRYGVDRTLASGHSLGLGALTANPQTFIADCHLHELERLRSELSACDPNVVIALGNTACWALLGQQGISGLRGTVHLSSFLQTREVKVLPTYHPAAVLRDYSLRAVTIIDLEKAVNESYDPTFQFDNTELWLNPTLADLAAFDATHMASAHECACDIETKRGQITAISFAPTPEFCLVIPFWIEPDGSPLQNPPPPHYWSEGDELLAWGFIRKWIERADLVKVFQNGLYDLRYLAGPYAMKPRNCSEDTMLAAHSRWSELQKGLGFLGSVHCNTPSWKSMRTFRKEEALKRDD